LNFEDATMADEKMRERLAQLHAELSEAHSQDPDSRQSLGQVLPDVRRAIDGVATDGDPQADSTLPERLERVAVQFEADHPTVARSLRRLVDLLGEVGI
jgi:hypothetical protein